MSVNLPYCRTILAALVLLAVVLAPGCRGRNRPYTGDWSYNTPPTAIQEQGPKYRDPSRQRVVVFGHLANPDLHPTGWRKVGPGMSDVLARTLLNHGDCDVWINPSIADRVDALLLLPPMEQDAAIQAIRERYPEVRYVVTGRVTDFQHTTDAPKTAKKAGMYDRRQEAFVAIQINVFDVELGRVVASDHVYGVAFTPTEASRELHGGVSFDSYLFWSTPLGEATEQAVAKAIGVINRVLPTRDQSIRIVKHLEDRLVEVAGGPETSFFEGHEYYVCIRSTDGETLDPVLDPDTSMPLKARIRRSRRIASTAWLLGKKPAQIDLRGAILTESLPVRQIGLEELGNYLP